VPIAFSTSAVRNNHFGIIVRFNKGPETWMTKPEFVSKYGEMSYEILWAQLKGKNA
jgi:hypothetical protein